MYLKIYFFYYLNVFNVSIEMTEQGLFLPFLQVIIILAYC